MGRLGHFSNILKIATKVVGAAVENAGKEQPGTQMKMEAQYAQLVNVLKFAVDSIANPRKDDSKGKKSSDQELQKQIEQGGGITPMKDSEKEAWPSDVQPWEILADYQWEPARRGETVRRLNVFPVRRKYIKNSLLDEDIQAGMETMGAALNGFFEDAMITDAPIVKVEEEPVLLSLPLHLMIEDPRQGNHAIHDAYREYGNAVKKKGVTPDDLRRSVLNQAWKMPYATKAEQLFRGMSPWKTEGGTEIRGFTLSSHGNATGSYYHLGTKCVAPYNTFSHDYVMDLYATSFPDVLMLIGTLLEKSWTVHVGESSTREFPWWGLLCRLYQMDLIELSLMEGLKLHIKAKPAELRDAFLEGSLPGAELLFQRRDLPAGSPELYEQARQELLSRDTLRANITQYEARWLTDPNGGVWELWDPDPAEYAMMAIQGPVYARDPRRDIADGVVGIDFGTKSTVVVSMSGTNRIQPERIGMGRFEQELRPTDYENPTVMEFCNIEQFLEAYRKRAGRPLTQWSDLSISHTAAQAWQNNTDTNAYFAFFSELKQWAGDQDRRVRIRDMAGQEIELQPYLELKDNDLDPIELYAYYIGLYINNMHTGRIFLEYLLSFPVTYSREVRKHIRESFRRGLRKSLPQALLEDEELAEAPYVDEGAGEPAAYAVCALEEYQFRPQGKEEVHYAVFDFGGGTTDFDFGVWRAADKENPKEQKYNYVITHFKDGGDQHLGGEVLLEQMAFHVFSRNRDKLREKGIVFTLPPECHLPGGEFLLSDSQEARSNTRTMMEQLRPLWERTEDYPKKYQDGQLRSVSLFNRQGEIVNVDLDVSQENLETLLRDRIGQGVTNFLYALDAAFEGNESFRERAEKIYIFLAGNSSKSPILWEAFEAQLQARTEAIRNQYLERGNDEAAEQEYFELFAALGTPQAEEQQRARVVQLDNTADNWLERPTGKTGVAIGLVRSRSGSKIKVVDEIPKKDEIKFKYYVGDEDENNCFRAYLERDTPFQQWVKLCFADAIHFGFYFTTSPMARLPGEMQIDGMVPYKTFRLPREVVDEDSVICLRATGPEKIEYAVAVDVDAANRGEYAYGPIPVSLQE